MKTVTLYRPTGPDELKLVEESGFKKWPPRLPGQPIFYPVTNQQYPPEKVTFLVSKADDRLEVWAGNQASTTFIRAYEVKAQSGGPGPKLREGDRQVPEGFYRIEGLNPNSAFHLSLKLDYPNAFDLQHARTEGRTQPGSDIFIHGKAASIGCLAMGDTVIEELFVLTVDTKRQNVDVVIAPTDPRVRSLSARDGPTWLGDLYEKIEHRFKKHGRADGI